MRYLKNLVHTKFYCYARLFSLLIAISFSFDSKCQSIYINPDSLRWYNFKGKVNLLSPFTAYTQTNLVAFLGVPMSFNPDNPPKIEVEFMQDSSWVNYSRLSQLPKSRQYDLFIHEKFHYLIAIIEAKKLRRDLLSRKFNNLTEFINAFKYYDKAIDEKNMIYDNETNHNVNQVAQAKWEVKINKELSGLKSIKLGL